MSDLTPGEILWMSPGATVGEEQSGRRPAVVVAGQGYLDAIETLALVVPITSVDRGWPNHVAVPGLSVPSWAMTEQIRTVSRERLHGHIGFLDDVTLARIRTWLHDFLER